MNRPRIVLARSGCERVAPASLTAESIVAAHLPETDDARELWLAHRDLEHPPGARELAADIERAFAAAGAKVPGPDGHATPADRAYDIARAVVAQAPDLRVLFLRAILCDAGVA